MDKFFKNRIYVVWSLLVVGVIFFLGFQVGQTYRPAVEKVTTLDNKTEGQNAKTDFAPFWKAWNAINDKFIPAYSTSTQITDDQTRVYGAIAGMVQAMGDPYTVFFPPVEAKSFNEEISGQIEGVGMDVGIKDGVLTVISPLKNTPAFRAGIKAGDKILKVNDTLTDKLSADEAIKLIRGKKGTTVRLTLFRVGVKEPFELSIVRDFIEVPVVDTETRGDVFVIRLYTFTATSPNLFRDALREFVDSGLYRLVIDLRGNPGGYMESAVDMASWFLPSGKVVVSEDFKNKADSQVFRSRGYNIFNEKLRLAILIDGGSASASEILAGALHDQGVAKLVGAQSFGKGSVQELVDITPDTSLKVTIARWLTPNGISISHEGLKPDFEVKLDEDAFKKGTDTQLNKAIEILDAK